MQRTHGASLDQSLRNIQKFQKPLCVANKRTVVGIVQNNPSLSQGMAQISDSRSILKPNRVIPSMFFIPQPLCVHVLDTFNSSHHRLSEIRQPKPELWRRKFLVLSNRHIGYSPRCIPRNPLVSRCHRHNTLRSRSTHCSLTDSADGGLCTWRRSRLNRPNTQATGHGTDSHVIHLLAS